MLKRGGYLFCVCAAYLLIISISLSAAQPQIPGQVLDWQKAAQESIAQKDLTGALENYQKITETFPNTVYAYDAWKQIAYLNIQTKNFDQAQSAAMQLCWTYRDQRWVVQAVFDVVEKCMYAGAGPQALAICTEAENQFSPNLPSARFTGWRGMVLANQKDFDAARLITEKLQTIQSNAADYLGAMGNIGWGYFCVGQWDDAISVYRQGIERYPDHKGAAYLQYQIIKTCLAKGDMKAVQAEMETFQKQFGHYDNTPGLICRLANDQYDVVKKCLWENKIEVADQWMELFLTHYKNCDSAMGLSSRLAGIYRQKGQRQQAIGIYKRLLTQFSSHEYIAEVQDALVETYADMGDLDKAQDAIKTDIERYPQHKGLLRMITRVAVETARAGDTAKAMELTQAIFDRKPQGTDLLFAYTTKARVYVHQDKDAEAQKLVDDMLLQLKDNPKDLSYHLFGVGEEYYSKAFTSNSYGQLSENAPAMLNKAIEFWQRPIFQEDTKQKVKVMYFTGMAYLYLKQYDAAIAQYKQAMDADPGSKDNANMLRLTGICYAALAGKGIGDLNETMVNAESAWQTIVEKYPNDPMSYDAAIRLAVFKERQNQWPQVAEAYTFFLSHCGNDPRKIQTMFKLANAYEQSGRKEAAKAAYTEYIQTAPVGDPYIGQAAKALLRLDGVK